VPTSPIQSIEEKEATARERIKKTDTGWLKVEEKEEKEMSAMQQITRALESAGN